MKKTTTVFDHEYIEAAKKRDKLKVPLIRNRHYDNYDLQIKQLAKEIDRIFINELMQERTK